MIRTVGGEQVYITAVQVDPIKVLEIRIAGLTLIPHEGDRSPLAINITNVKDIPVPLGDLAF